MLEFSNNSPIAILVIFPNLSCLYKISFGG